MVIIFYMGFILLDIYISMKNREHYDEGPNATAMSVDFYRVD